MNCMLDFTKSFHNCCVEETFVSTDL